MSLPNSSFSSPQAIAEPLLAEMESLAASMAQQGGAILAGHFARLGALGVRYKDKRRRDPVTDADTECQRFLVDAISERFPEHGILGEEEEDKERESAPAPDMVWVLDPLDGTRNFLNGLPVYACSVGVMHRGAPVAGAVYIPWPGEGGLVLRARRGGGAFAAGEPIGVYSRPDTDPARLVTLPAYFGAAYAFREPMRRKVGELRNLGSIAYDMAMVAMGVTQYAITTGPHLWDVAGGLAVASEAGARIMLGHRRNRLLGLAQSTRWERAESLLPAWRGGQTTMSDLRRWVMPIALGNPALIERVTSGLRTRPAPLRRLRHRWRMRRQGG